MRPEYVIIDFETRAACDLKRSGVERYVECPHFDALCLGYQWPFGEPLLWRRGEPPPKELCDFVASGGLVVAHNAGFELAVWNELRRRDPRWPELKPKQVEDTMIRARAMGLPGGLDQLCGALRLPITKDRDGHAVMLKLCKPRKALKHEDQSQVYFHEEPELHRRNEQYCLVDIAAEHGAWRHLPALMPRERELWILDQKINQRGVGIDVESAELAAAIVEEEKATLNSQFRQFTNGKVSTGNQRNKILEWLEEQGIVLGSLKKADVQRLLDDPDALANKETAKTVLGLRQEAAKASTSKLKAMLRSACADTRARGLFAFHGANTARWAGRRIQTQNLPRTPKNFKPKDAAQVISWLRNPRGPQAMRLWHGSPMDAISWSLRSFLKAAPGRKYVSCDLANIEGRVLAWLAGEEWKLEAFRDYDTIIGTDAKGEPIRKGPDLYILAYARAFGVPLEDVDDIMRQIGKVMELFLGYQGGLGAFASGAANYGFCVVPKKEDAPANAKQVLTEAEAETIKTRWREANPAIVQFWYDLNDAAMEAVRSVNPKTGAGSVTRAGRIHYRVNGDFLLCLLPSGRCMVYPYPSIKYMTTTFYEREVQKWRDIMEDAAEEAHTDDGARRWGQARDILQELLDNPDKREQLVFWGVSSKSKNKKWGPQRAYGGLLAENVTQATARDVLADSFPRIEAAGYPIVMHVHDETLCEPLEAHGSWQDLARLMVAVSSWADGLPVAAAGWEGDRYRK